MKIIETDWAPVLIKCHKCNNFAQEFYTIEIMHFCNGHYAFGAIGSIDPAKWHILCEKCRKKLLKL